MATIRLAIRNLSRRPARTALTVLGVAVAIARALANQPLLLLADEPTGNLDSRSTEEIATLLKKTNSEHKTAILLVTHDPGIGKIANKLVRMIDGRIDIEKGSG